MSKIKALLLATASSVALAGGIQAVQAADLPLKAPPVYKPAFSWTGCHVGAHWGWGWGKKDSTGTSAGIATFLSKGGNWNNTVSGPIFGGQLGCDYQWPSTNFVIGIEGSYSAADINGRNAPIAGGTHSTGVVQSKIDSIGSVTGRIGWNGWDPMVLLYLKGGWAWMHERDHIQTGSDWTYTFSSSNTGWTIGGGIEWAWSFAPRWSSFVEYDHYDFKRKFVALAIPTGADTCCGANIKTHVDTVKIGVNYKLFAGP